MGCTAPAGSPLRAGVRASVSFVAQSQGGKTKFTIENATKTRVVLADSKVNILGAYKNIKACR